MRFSVLFERILKLFLNFVECVPAGNTALYGNESLYKTDLRLLKMKSMIMSALAAAVLSLMIPGAAASAEPGFVKMVELLNAKPKKELKEVTFSVSMHCGKCVAKISENISFEKGVKDLKVSLDQHTVWIKYDVSKTSWQTLKSAVEKLGYEVSVLQEAGQES